MVFFSVVIPTYNRADLITKAINSALQQEFSDYEILVVDDGSTDNTLEALEPYKGRIRVFHQQNQGPGAARNLGIQYALGQYIAFLDSDDLWFSWTLSTFYHVIQKKPSLNFIAGNSVFFKDEAELRSASNSSLTFQEFTDYYASSKHSLWLGTCSVIIRTNILQKVGGFIDRRINGEDSDLWLRLGTIEGFAFIESPTLFAYRRHTNSAISNHSNTYNGIQYLIEREKAGLYLGGKAREQERREILTRHVRPVSLACLTEGQLRNAWKLYKETLLWHLTLKRFRYLLCFPLIIALSLLKIRWHISK